MLTKWRRNGSAAGDTVPLAEQITCIRRELGLRRTVYAREVHFGRMRAADATREIRAMQAVLDTLNALGGAPTAIQPEIPL